MSLLIFFISSAEIGFILYNIILLQNIRSVYFVGLVQKVFFYDQDYIE